MKHHIYSIETLYHFKCYDCEKWWSVGDWEFSIEIICPHCGRVAVAIENKET